MHIKMGNVIVSYKHEEIVEMHDDYSSDGWVECSNRFVGAETM